MKMIKVIAVAAIGTMLAIYSPAAFAQWDEDEEQGRIEDQQREDVLFQGSEVGTHDDSIKKPKNKRWHQPPPPPQPGETMTPDQEIEGTTEYQK